MNFAVLQFPASNCDQDALHVVKNVLGQSARFVWHKENSLAGMDAVIVPGGFSYGDYLRTGAIARFSPIMQAVQTFAAGLKHCDELDGTTFYMQTRDRVLRLEDYHHSLDNLAAQGVFNPETKRPWNQQDADARWEVIKKEAATDQTTCALVASLPDLQKKLDDLQRQAAAPQSTTPPDAK